MSSPRPSQKLSPRLSVIWGRRLGHLKPRQNLWVTNGAFFHEYGVIRVSPWRLWEGLQYCSPACLVVNKRIVALANPWPSLIVVVFFEL